MQTHSYDIGRGRAADAVQPMHPARLDVPKSGVLALSGYGVRIAVERRHLVVSDGIGNERRIGRISRAGWKVKRLVLLGHSGYITLQALRWLHDLGTAVIQLDTDGNVILTTAPAGLDDPRLRRAQALAPFTGAGVLIIQDLINRKLTAQARTLERIAEAFPELNVRRGQNIDFLGHLRESVIPEVEDASRLRNLEAAAAEAYWACWQHVPTRFARTDVSRVPEHWLSFGQRRSLVSGSPRLASNPANALLNYLYAVLEAEARIACLTIGLDPGLGLLHADQRARDSLALDLMETVRADADLFLLELLAQRTFAAREFIETREGNCRLVAPLPSILAEIAPRFRALLAPEVERVAELLGRVVSPIPGNLQLQSRRVSVPTLLTEKKRRTGRISPGRRLKPSQPLTIAIPPNCQGCGAYLGKRSRTYCDECLVAKRAENLEDLPGPAALARLRAEGEDPAQRPEVRSKKRATMTSRRQAIVDWEQQHERSNPDQFRAEILPGLQAVPVRRIMAATGLSLIYCSLIRRGERVPHRIHWQAFRALVETQR